MGAAEIAIGSENYQGVASLGGYDAGVIKIDTNPIQQLAEYTYHYKKTNTIKSKKKRITKYLN